MARVITSSRWYQGIANAIRSKSGSGAPLPPEQMAAAIQALTVHGTLDGVQEPAYGGVSQAVTTEDTHYRQIAAAIREKNGSTVQYRPDQMAAAIIAFDMEVKAVAFSFMVTAEHKNFTKVEMYYGEGESRELIRVFTQADYIPSDYAYDYVERFPRILTEKIYPLGIYTFRGYDSGKTQDLTIPVTKANTYYAIHILSEPWPLA